MRISDWSSDVCSSDLRYHSPVAGVPASAGYQCPSTDRNAEPSVSIQRAAGRSCDASRQARLPRRACPHKRSEEHTSELQSLMRISYAVFCLKKKTLSQE